MPTHDELPGASLATLPNGVRVVTIPMPHLESACVSVFVRAGSQHESRRHNGISHLAEHMAFKGTASRSCQQINLDAERLGAEANAHTDKDHTAFHMRGMAQHAGRFVQMLADIVQHGTFPEAELEREREVLLQEYLEEDDDAFSAAYKLFDRLSYGTHSIAQPVIGTRGNIERLTREDLLAYVRRHYTGANVIVGVAGNVEPEAIVREVQGAFGDLPQGSAHVVAPPAWRGGIAARRMAGVSQTHVVLGFPAPALTQDAHHASVVAAALFGEGMSSPLMDEIRERRGLVYYAACSCDATDIAGQFVIEASMSPGKVQEFAAEVTRLLRAHADAIDPLHLERARNQIAVRRLEVQERPFRRIEEAVQDVFAFARVRTNAETMDRVRAVTAQEVRDAFARMLDSQASVAMAGRVSQAALASLRGLVASAP
jgi:predicted Zn-dependent peptidase